MSIDEALRIAEGCCCGNILPSADSAKASAVVDAEIEQLRDDLAAARKYIGELTDQVQQCQHYEPSHAGLRVSKCEKCGGYKMELDNPPGLCGCQGVFVTGCTMEGVK